MGILLCEQNFRDVWRRNKSVRAEIGHILRTHTHAAKLVVEIYTIVACAFKRKSSAARFALNLTAKTQASSTKVQSIGTTEPIRTGGSPAQTSPFISLA